MDTFLRYLISRCCLDLFSHASFGVDVSSLALLCSLKILGMQCDVRRATPDVFICMQIADQ
jgi:hypothetical protein